MNRLMAAMFVLLAAGCGPVTYMSQVGVRANKAYAGAKDVHGEKYAPYEYYAGYYYLKRARIKGGYADYEFAKKYGYKSEKMFRKARRLSVERVARGESAHVSSPKAKASQPKKLVIIPANQDSGEDEK